jgi:hypothetical protein
MTSIDLDVAKYSFLDPNLVSVFEQQPGQDITNALNAVLDTMSAENRTANMDCLSNAFYWGETDFRYTPRCQVQNYLLLVFSSVIMASMAMKCTSSSYVIPTCANSIQSLLRFSSIPSGSPSYWTSLCCARFLVTRKERIRFAAQSTRLLVWTTMIRGS